MRQSFFFILAILSITTVMVSTNAYAEIGQNFDRTQIEPNQFQWSSHYDRIFDGTKWVNYKWNDNGNIITFESANIIYKFDKNLCTFQLLNPDTKQVSINSFNHSLIVDGIEQPLSACSVTSTTPTLDDLEIKVKRTGVDGELVTIYDMQADGGMEWTHEIININLLKIAKFGMAETCEKCTGTSLGGDLISFGDYILDTKNRVHNTLKSTDSKTEDYGFVYEGGVMVAGQKLIIDPTFSGVATLDGYVTDSGANDICDTNGSMVDNPGGDLGVGTLLHASIDCARGYAEFNTTNIPDGVTVTNATLQFDIDSVVSPRNWDIHHMVAQPSTETTTDKFIDASNGTIYVNTAVVLTTGNFKDVDLGITARSDIQSRLTLNWFALGFVTDSEANAGTQDHLSRIPASGTGTPDPTLIVQYTIGPPDAVTDLTNSTTRDTSVRLSWSQPILNGGNLTGYQINYTTPFGNPLTIINNNTESSTTNTNVTGLTHSTQYTFRVSAWTELGNNASGNKLNVTTLQFVPVNFTLGFLDVNVTNPDIFPIRFARTDINATSLFLNVTYSKTYNLTCSFYYKFAMTNATYSNLSNVTVSADEIRSDFTFVNASNEVIDVFCKNENSPNNGTYILTQTSFPLLAQFRNFTGGVYGTTGQFGTVNLVTLGIIIASMIGFNRINPSVGAIFTIIIIFGAGYFGFITIPEQMIAAFILVAVLAFMTTKKDD